MPADNQYGFQDDRVDSCRLPAVSYPQLGPPPPYPANPMRRPPPVSVCCPVLIAYSSHPTHPNPSVEDAVEVVQWI